jgi:Recombination endonuclease VII
MTETERVAFNLSLLYGVSIEQYNQMRADQDYRCAICGLHESESKAGGPNPNVRRLHLDHDHKTGVPRGLLCRDCNTMLGNALDDPARLRGGIEYLRRWALKQLDELQRSLSA